MTRKHYLFICNACKSQHQGNIRESFYFPHMCPSCLSRNIDFAYRFDSDKELEYSRKMGLSFLYPYTYHGGYTSTFENYTEENKKMETEKILYTYYCKNCQAVHNETKLSTLDEPKYCLDCELPSIVIVEKETVIEEKESVIIDFVNILDQQNKRNVDSLGNVKNSINRLEYKLENNFQKPFDNIFYTFLMSFISLGISLINLGLLICLCERLIQ